MSEAPPKIAPVRPKAVGITEGLTAATHPSRGARESPRPMTPIPYMACLRGEFVETKSYIFSVALSFSYTLLYWVFIIEVEMSPTRVEIIPPKARGVIMAVNAGMESTA